MMSRLTLCRSLVLFSAFMFAGALIAQTDTIRLKNGRVIQGRVLHFGKGEFIVLVERAGARSHPQDRMIVLVDAVDTIEFDAGAATTPSVSRVGTPAEKVIVLDSRREVVPTGIQLRRGDRVRIRASGEMQFPDGRVTKPGGVASSEPFLPFPGEPLGVLVAMVGDPRSPVYHVIGKDAELEARSDGELFLQINVRSLQGARGAYTARLTTSPGSAAARASGLATSDALRQLRAELSVPADRDWIDTGLDLLQGDTLRITASGSIFYTSSETSNPDGGESTWRDLLRSLPVNDVGRGALIGKMGEGGAVRAFFVGSSAEFVAERNGRLFLGVNDNDYNDNRGSFQVTVEIQPASR